MTKNDLKKLIKSLTKEILAEDYKGEPNHAAEVESDELTAHLSENDTVKDIADLEKLLKNPDSSRAKDYGSILNYKKMLMGKIARLKNQKNESGDPFRDTVKKYASLNRDSELSRREKNLIDQAIKKFPKAKRIDVENFTSRYDHLSGEAALNLLVAAAEFRKNSGWSAEEVEHYINAISWVLNHKHAFKTMAN